MKKISALQNTFLLVFLLAALGLFFIESFDSSFMCGWGGGHSLPCQFSNQFGWSTPIILLVLCCGILGTVVNYFKKYISTKIAFTMIALTVLLIAPITGVEAIQKYNHLVSEHASAAADPNVCDWYIIENIKSGRCKLAATMVMEDVNACGNLPTDDFLQIQCVEYYATGKPSSFCESISFESGRDTCYRRTAYQARDAKVCKKIVDDWIRELCEDGIEYVINSEKAE